MTEKVLSKLSRERFLLWAVLMTAADLVLTYIGIISLDQRWESNPLVLCIITQLGLANGFTLLMFAVSAFILLMTIRWTKRWVKVCALGILAVKGYIFLYHFLLLHVANLI